MARQPHLLRLSDLCADLRTRPDGLQLRLGVGVLGDELLLDLGDLDARPVGVGAGLGEVAVAVRAVGLLGAVRAGLTCLTLTSSSNAGRASSLIRMCMS